MIHSLDRPVERVLQRRRSLSLTSVIESGSSLGASGTGKPFARSTSRKVAPGRRAGGPAESRAGAKGPAMTEGSSKRAVARGRQREPRPPPESAQPPNGSSFRASRAVHARASRGTGVRRDDRKCEGGDGGDEGGDEDGNEESEGSESDGGERAELALSDEWGLVETGDRRAGTVGEKVAAATAAAATAVGATAAAAMAAGSKAVEAATAAASGLGGRFEEVHDEDEGDVEQGGRDVSSMRPLTMRMPEVLSAAPSCRGPGVCCHDPSVGTCSPGRIPCRASSSILVGRLL